MSSSGRRRARVAPLEEGGLTVDRKQPSSPPADRKRAAPWILGAGLWLAVLALLGALSTRHDFRVDLSYGQRRSLATETVQLLEKLDRPVKALAFYADVPQERRLVQRLLERYQRHSHFFSYEFVDLERHPEMADKYQVSLNRTLVLVSGDLQLRLHEPRESELSGALLRILNRTPAQVVFITGHGEASIEDASGKGLKNLAKAIRHQNYVVRKLDLPSASSIPSTADVVVLAAPEGEMLPRELDMLTGYLLHGGRLMAMLEIMGSASADSLVSVFGVDAEQAFVIDPSEEQRNVTAGASNRIAMARGANPKHPATSGFTYVTVYPIARALSSVQPPPPGSKVSYLVRTGPQAWGETNLQQLGDPSARYDPGVDLKGPITLAYAVDTDLRIFRPDWREHPGGIDESFRELNPSDSHLDSAADTIAVDGSTVVQKPRLHSRVVVTGDVDFVNNANLSAWGNGDLFLDLLLWLSEAENRVAFAPGPKLYEPVMLTLRQIFWLRVLGMAVIPAIFFILAVAVAWRRRSWL